MSDFHYVRTLGRDGGVDVCSGQAIGEELGAILEDGLPPFNVALHIIAALCEILDITEEDGEVHGNIDPRYIFIDDTGAVSLEGFGQSRTRAPEGKPRGPMTDLYGLGYTAFKLFTSGELPPLPTDDADAHDDAVIDEILGIDFEGLNEEMIGDVQWFLAKLLAFDREDRPPAVECWRTFVAFADEARGPDFVNWCLDALDGGGERRSGADAAGGAAAGAAAGGAEEPADDLDGPLVSRGPLQRGGLAFDPGAAAAGGTAFFSKDDLKAALDRQEPQKPAAGGGSATSYWSRDELSAMAKGTNGAPRPKRAKGEGERRKTMAMQKKDVQRSRGTASATKPARNEQKIKSDPPVPAAPAPPPPSHQPAPPVPRPPQPQKDFDRPAAFDQPEPTIRMQSDKPRTTRTPAPAPQVFRPPGLAGNNSAAPSSESAPGRPSRSPSQPPRPLEPQPSEVATRVQDAAEVQQALRESEAQRAREARTHSQSGHGAPAGQAPSNPAPAIKGPQNPPPQLPVEPPVPAYDTGYVETDEGSSFNLVLIGGIALVLVIAVVACIGLGGLGGAVAFVTTGSTTTPVENPDPTPTPKPLPGPALPDPNNGGVDNDGNAGTDGDDGEDGNGKDGTKPSPSPSPTPRPTTRPTPRPSPSPSPTPRPTTRPTPRPSPSPSPTPRPTTRPTPSPQPMVRPQPDPEPVADPAPVTGPITLTLKSRDRGRLMCPGVGSKEFDGNTLINIESYQLPATCLVTIEGKKEAFQVKGAGSVTCNLAGSRVSCDKSVVQ